MEIDPLSRYLGAYLSRHPEDLEKMVFVAGPRQVGKTTLLESIGSKLGFEKVVSLNWDRPKDRLPIRDINYSFFQEQVLNSPSRPLIIFDELHKYPKWKSFLKGYFDTFRRQLATFVTGSARLDVYRRGGDSLLGRYWLLHFNPFSVSEAIGKMEVIPPERLLGEINTDAEESLKKLLQWGGFPEPFLAESDPLHRRWKKMRRERLIQEDLRDLSKIHDLHYIDNLMDLVIGSVGSTLSTNSLKNSLNVSYNAVRTWLKWLEAIYYCFPIFPYSKRITRSLKKEAKYFLFDWSEIEDPGARFENLVAMHLKKSVDFWNDTGAGNFQLYYLRDLEKREVDFAILKDKKIWMLVECKLKEDNVPSPLQYMTHFLKPPHAVLVTAENKRGEYRVVKGEKFWVTGAASFLQNFV